MFSLNYDSSGAAARLISVISNRGYALLLEHAGGSRLVSKACVINLAFAAISTSCPADAPAATYSYAGNVQTAATMPTGGTWAFVDHSPGSFSLIRPGESAPFVNNAFEIYMGSEDIDANLAIIGQTFSLGTSYTYGWSRVTNVGEDTGTSIIAAGGNYVDGSGRGVTVSYGQYYKQTFNAPSGDPSIYVTPGPVLVQDQLGRKTVSNYCDDAATTGFCPYLEIPPLKSVTDPDGNSESYIYTNFRNVQQIIRKAKLGSGLADLVETREYGGYQYPTYRAKPTSITDGRGNVIDYTYDSVHGGVLSESGPADASGVRPVKRSGYVQRYAWISNGAGGYVPAASPVWLLNEERTCRTSATVDGGCAAGAGDEVVTTYEYGPDAGPNNLLLRGVAVSADDQVHRTCYGYDARGNRVSETKPRAGLGVCP